MSSGLYVQYVEPEPHTCQIKLSRALVFGGSYEDPYWTALIVHLSLIFELQSAKKKYNNNKTKKHLCSAWHTNLSLHFSPQLTFTEAMRNKARLSITGSVGENGRVLTPDCPKAVHAGPLHQSSGLALVSSELP